jgi:hypothetical protein
MPKADRVLVSAIFEGERQWISDLEFARFFYFLSLLVSLSLESTVSCPLITLT